MILVDENQARSTIVLPLGEQLQISLPGNPTTGYEWMLQSVDSAILESPDPPVYHHQGYLPGAPGRYTLRLKAIAVGQTPVEMVYRRSFEPPAIPPVDQFRIFVVVQE